MTKNGPVAANHVGAEAFVVISALVADYCLALDANDFDRFRNIWTEDARFTAEPDLGALPVPLSGRDAIVAAFESRPRRKDSLSRHYTTNLRLTSGEHGTVHGISAMLAIANHVSDGSLSLHRTGWYHDVFAVENGEWRIISRLLQYDAADPAGEVPA